jgi:hypothetical protein
MTRFSKHSTKETASYSEFSDQQVVNFMNGISYRINPIDTLKMVAASSIFGEASYYRDSHESEKYIDRLVPWAKMLTFDDTETTTSLFMKVVDQALEHDFAAVLKLAEELRKDYFMRLNPGLILVKAALHKNRAEFNKTHCDDFRNTGKEIIQRPDDITNQFDLFMFLNKTKNKLPSILKRIWKDKLEGFSRYQINKYKGKNLIDLVRISHANNELINELMRTGTVVVSDSEKTWENLRSEGKTWSEILGTTYIPHMALLRNLRNIFINQPESNPLKAQLSRLINIGKIKSEADPDLEYKTILKKLKEGVSIGKQFPFRYFSAYREIEKADVLLKGIVLDTLEECLDISIDNFPKMKGKTICLSDNSGSAWGAIPSEYGTVTVAEIGNLSSIITAMQSDEGYVGVFGDKLSIKPVSQRNGIINQLKETCERGRKQGGSTENGIWLFFSEALKNKEKYDNIFIYSDMQAGHGNLYGTNATDYKDFTIKGNYIDVLKLVMEYRKKVNQKVNLFSVQVAGYNNSVTPENLYRSSILTGWTGKEVIYANYLINSWDEIEGRDKGLL